MDNLFSLPNPLPEQETFEALVPDRGVLIERIHERHRVERTSREPPCIWLAVHGDLRGVRG